MGINGSYVMRTLPRPAANFNLASLRRATIRMRHLVGYLRPSVGSVGWGLSTGWSAALWTVLVATSVHATSLHIPG